MDKCNTCNGAKEVLVEYEGGEFEYRDCHCIEGVDRVYLVKTSEGSFEDYREWIVCVYEDEEHAKYNVLKLNELLKIDKEKNIINRNKCNECDKCEDDTFNTDEEYVDNCFDCEYDFDYNLDDRHEYRIETCDFIRKEK